MQSNRTAFQCVFVQFVDGVFVFLVFDWLTPFALFWPERTFSCKAAPLFL